MFCSLTSVHIRLWSRNPDFHDLVQQQCDIVSGEAQLELQLHWQSSMEMDSRDDDDDGEFCLRAEDMGLGLKSLNTLECSLEWSLLDLLFKVCH